MDGQQQSILPERDLRPSPSSQTPGATSQSTARSTARSTALCLGLERSSRPDGASASPKASYSQFSEPPVAWTPPLMNTPSSTLQGPWDPSFPAHQFTSSSPERSASDATEGPSPSRTARDATQQRPFSVTTNVSNRSAQSLSSNLEVPPIKNTTYQIPPAPAPPILHRTEPLSLYKTNASFRPLSGYISRPTSALEKAGQKLSAHFNSVRLSKREGRRSSISTGHQYGILDDEQENDISTARSAALISQGSRAGYKSLREGEEEEEEVTEPLVFDVSSYDDPINLRSYPAPHLPPSTTLKDQEQMQSTLAAEYYQSEPHSMLTGGLGGGMVGSSLRFDPIKNVSTAQGMASDVPLKTATAGLSRGMTLRDVGRREARERNEIVIINEVVPNVDVGFLGADDELGGVLVKRSHTGASLFKNQKQLSYFFPQDPEMPNWKPSSMRWPYITLLIFLSLAMAGIQEYLYQISNYKSKRNDGLIKFVRPKELGIGLFFCWKYLPTLIAVTFGILWQIVDYDVRRLEAYYRLSRREGALAAESINLNYLTSYTVLIPFIAMRYRHWAVLYSSTIFLIAGPVVAVLQNGSMIVIPKQENRKATEPKVLAISMVWSRILSSFLVLVAILGCLLLYELRRKSGLLSDPKGIAGVAAMANKSHILMDFKDLDTATEADIRNRLKHRRYNLHKSTLWQGEYLSGGDGTFEDKKTVSPHPIMLRLAAGVPYIAFMLFFMGFIPLLMFVARANVVAQKLPWLLTAIASVIRVVWTTLDSDVRLMEPFYILSRRGAPSSTLTLDYTGTIPGWLPIKAFFHGHYLVALVGLGAVMSEVLTVCVSSLGVRADIFFPGHSTTENEGRSNSEETFKSVWVSFALVMSILTWLCLTAALVYHRRRHVFLPREPGTIASVLAFVHQSKMLWDFVDTETMNSHEMTKHLKSKGKTYGFGWFKGRDGNDHCGIDEEPLTTSYVHGVPFANAVKPWSGGWDRY